MALYFFDTHDGYHLAIDEEGVELDPSKVRREALSALADMAHDNLPKGNLDRIFVSVRDTSGKVAFRTTVALIIEEEETQPS